MVSDKSTEKAQTTIVWPDGTPDRVGIRGTFGVDAQQWWQETIELRKTAADRYSVELDLPPGKYEFKFVINNTDWRVNSQMYDSVDDGSGNTNNVLEVVAPSSRSNSNSNSNSNSESKSSKASSKTAHTAEQAQEQKHEHQNGHSNRHNHDHDQGLDPTNNQDQGQGQSLASDPYTDIKEDSQKASEQTPLLGVGSSKGASKARTSFDTDAELESQSGSTGEQDEGRAEDSEDGSDGVGSWRNKARRYIICAAAVLAIAALGLTGGMLYS
ncbi:hypothetical protein H4R99_004618 [Coemansia sp. RSA 1722]|nr:hypothetical protein H4R99_004618 [Coemansia sp. RSA 1722]KAJ2599505.1 hypothetical protein GGF39_002191 [Coemansia sp. RSA 1721]